MIRASYGNNPLALEATTPSNSINQPSRQCAAGAGAGTISVSRCVEDHPEMLQDELAISVKIWLNRWI
jgi:hypothetical protein